MPLQPRGYAQKLTLTHKLGVFWGQCRNEENAAEDDSDKGHCEHSAWRLAVNGQDESISSSITAVGSRAD